MALVRSGNGRQRRFGLPAALLVVLVLAASMTLGSSASAEEPVPMSGATSTSTRVSPQADDVDYPTNLPPGAHPVPVTIATFLWVGAIPNDPRPETMCYGEVSLNWDGYSYGEPTGGDPEDRAALIQRPNTGSLPGGVVRDPMATYAPGLRVFQAEDLTGKVLTLMHKLYAHGSTPSVEEVQDRIEKVLIESGHVRTAKAFILYRAERARVREKKDAHSDVQDNSP